MNLAMKYVAWPKDTQEGIDNRWRVVDNHALFIYTSLLEVLFHILDVIFIFTFCCIRL